MRVKAWMAIGILLVSIGIGVTMLICMASEKSEKPIGEKRENQFDAMVTAVDEEYLLVEAEEGQTIAGEVKVMTGLLEKDSTKKIKVGDCVRITHDGKMTMSLPPQMSAIEEIIFLQ